MTKSEMKQLLSIDRIRYLMYEPHLPNNFLTPKIRKVLQEVLLDGKTYAQVGENLDVSGTRVHQILVKSFKQLLSFDEEVKRNDQNMDRRTLDRI